MSKQSIRATIVETLGEGVANSYPSYVDTVVEALEERESALVSWITQEAERRYGYGSQAAEILTAAPEGAFPSPVEEPEAAGEPVADTDDLAAAVREIKSTLDGLVEFARTNGYQR